MITSRLTNLVLGTLAGLALLTGCDRAPTGPRAALTSTPLFQQGGNGPAVADPTGQRTLGGSVIEPGYDATTGELVYMLTPEKAPRPTNSNAHSVAPLWLVVYPAGSSVASAEYHLSCEGVPGNCPTHDAKIAGLATSAEPAVYGTDPTAVPGHDHLFASPGNEGDFNIAWELNVVVFTPQGKADGAIDTHITTEAQIEQAQAAGDVRVIDLGTSVLCSVVSPATYAKATPLSQG